MKHFYADRRAFTLVEFLVIVAVLGVLGLLVGVVFMAQVPFFVAFGWIWGLHRLVTGLVHEPVAVVLGISAFLVLPLTFHLFAKPIARRCERNWTLRNSFAASLILVLVAASGIAIAAGFHDFLWFFPPSEPIIDTGMQGPARRMQSINHLRQFGAGVHNYSDEYYILPSGGTVLDDGRLGHGWMTQILPFCHRQELYDKIDLTKPWDAPENEAIFKETVAEYRSPYLRILERELPPEPRGFARTDYAANQFVLPVGRAIRFQDIVDGASNTMLSGEVTENLQPWGNPVNGRDLRLGINRSPFGFGSKHIGGVNIGRCDGSVTFLSETADPKILEALATPDGGEEVP